MGNSACGRSSVPKESKDVRKPCVEDLLSPGDRSPLLPWLLPAFPDRRANWTSPSQSHLQQSHTNVKCVPFPTSLPVFLLGVPCSLPPPWVCPPRDPNQEQLLPGLSDPCVYHLWVKRVLVFSSCAGFLYIRQVPFICQMKMTIE